MAINPYNVEKSIGLIERAYDEILTHDCRTLTLGVSGYLYRSAVLYHDDETETFWSQMTGEAVVGPLSGRRVVRGREAECLARLAAAEVSL